MTILLQTVRHGTSKAVLAENLNTAPRAVVFLDPDPWDDKAFRGDSIAPGQSFACVLDHPARRRFATVVRKADGTFVVR